MLKLMVSEVGRVDQRQKSLNLPGASSVYRTVCWIFRCLQSPGIGLAPLNYVSNSAIRITLQA